jgi:DNA processing protein
VLGVGTGAEVGISVVPSSPVTLEGYGAERDAWAVLAAVIGLGPIGFSALLAHHGSGRAIIRVAAEPGAVERLAATPPFEPGRRERPITDPVARAIVSAVQGADRVLDRLRSLGIHVLTVEEPAYPARLGGIAMPPHVLYVVGSVDALARNRSVAVVGTRRATVGGRITAGRIADALVAADATVVSGLAFGIDGAAHEATLRAGGTTVAVIGGGHATLGPRPHVRMAEAIVAAGGAVASELGPDTEPSKGTFPRRNRIISGLSDATVVVEAPARSGALITASWALEQGRGCYLVPGGIDDPAAAGSLAFLREFEQETHLVAGIPQLIADLGFAGPAVDGRRAVSAATTQGLGVVESAIAKRLLAGLATVDELVAATGLPVAAVLAALTLLDRRGLTVGAHGRYRPSALLLGGRTTLWHEVRSIGGVPVARSERAVLP